MTISIPLVRYEIDAFILHTHITLTFCRLNEEYCCDLPFKFFHISYSNNWLRIFQWNRSQRNRQSKTKTICTTSDFRSMDWRTHEHNFEYNFQTIRLLADSHLRALSFYKHNNKFMDFITHVYSNFCIGYFDCCRFSPRVISLKTKRALQLVLR